MLASAPGLAVAQFAVCEDPQFVLNTDMACSFMFPAANIPALLYNICGMHLNTYHIGQI